MKFFAISLALLVGATLSEAFRNYNVNYGNLNAKDYTRQLLASERYQHTVDDPAYVTRSRYQGNNPWGTAQQPPLTYPIYGTQNTVGQAQLLYNIQNGWANPNNANIGQQQIVRLFRKPLTYPIYGTQNTVGQAQLLYNIQNGQQQIPLTNPIYGTQNTVGQSQLNVWRNQFTGQQQIRPTYPIYGTQNTVGQTQLNTQYDPYGNQRPVKEEWIVPVKATVLYEALKPQTQFKTNSNRVPRPVKTTYYNR